MVSWRALMPSSCSPNVFEMPALGLPAPSWQSSAVLTSAAVHHDAGMCALGMYASTMAWAHQLQRWQAMPTAARRSEAALRTIQVRWRRTLTLGGLYAKADVG